MIMHASHQIVIFTLFKIWISHKNEDRNIRIFVEIGSYMHRMYETQPAMYIDKSDASHI